MSGLAACEGRARADERQQACAYPLEPRGRPWLRSGIAALALLTALAGCAADQSASAEQLARGEELYKANCMACHGGGTGGDIADIPPRHNAEGHTWHHADCDLVDIVLDGMPRRPELGEDVPAMPSFADQFDEDDVEAILAYIKTWWETDQLEHQRQVTEQVCD